MYDLPVTSVRQPIQAQIIRTGQKNRAELEFSNASSPRIDSTVARGIIKVGITLAWTYSRTWCVRQHTNPAQSLGGVLEYVLLWVVPFVLDVHVCVSKFVDSI